MSSLSSPKLLYSLFFLILLKISIAPQMNRHSRDKPTTTLPREVRWICPQKVTSYTGW